MDKVAERNLEKAKERLEAARLLLEDGKFEDAVNRGLLLDLPFRDGTTED